MSMKRCFVRRRNGLILVAVFSAMLAARFAEGQEVATVVPENGTLQQATPTEFIETIPLPPNTVFKREPRNGVHAGPPAGQRVIYSNTLGNFTVPIPANTRLADDIALSSAPGCRLRRLEFPVVPRANPELAGGPFTISIELFSNCPNSVPQTTTELDRIRIPDTAMTQTIQDDAPQIIAFDFNAGEGIVLPPGVNTFWWAFQVNRTNFGMVAGSPASIGFGSDLYDFPGGGYACNAHFGGYPGYPYAGFQAELFGDSDFCSDAHVGYRANRPSQGILNPGANFFLTDDIQLPVSSCRMIGYEVAVKGFAGYSFELRETCDAPAIAGTATNYVPPVGIAASASSMHRALFDPPITIPKNLYFAASVSNSQGGVVVSGQKPGVGFTEDFFEVPQTGGGCNLFFNPISGQHDALNVTIYCQGPAPTGACCDMQFADANGESVCREVPQMNCPWPWKTGLQPDWVEGATCDSDPFPNPCGVAACCRPDDTCENVTENECNAVPPLDRLRFWQQGRYCQQGDQACPIIACLEADGPCAIAQGMVGCADIGCCASRCLEDRWCCEVEWDQVCLWEDPYCAPPSNYYCAEVGMSPGPIQLIPNTSTVVNNTWGDYVPNGKVISCFRGHAGVGARGVGATWYWFEAVDPTVRINTCGSTPPIDDSLVTIYRSTPSSSSVEFCDNLVEIACNDDADGCAGGRGSDLCIGELIPGEVYLVQVAFHSTADFGVFQLDLESPCPQLSRGSDNSILTPDRSLALVDSSDNNDIGAASRPAAAVLTPMEPTQKTRLVRVDISTGADLHRLQILEFSKPGLELWSEQLRGPFVDVRATPVGQKVLQDAGLRYAVVIDDLELHWTSLRSSVAGGGFFTSYQSYEAHVAFLEELAAAHPDLAETFSFGTSVEGRSLAAIRIGKPGPNKSGVLYHGAQHGNEMTGAAAIAFIAQKLLTDYDNDPKIRILLDNLDWYLLPIMNPDGYVSGSRYNSRGVDLNRNWLAFTEPETRALRDFLVAHPNLRSHVDLHTYGNMIMWPWGHTAVATEDNDTFDFIGDEMASRIFAVRGTNYTRRGPIYTTIYPVVGGSIDYSYSEFSHWSFVFEIGTSYAAPASQLELIGQEMYSALSFLSAWVWDCNGNLVDDLQDVLSTSSDDNLNRTPDECELQYDFDADGIWDILDEDIDNDGVSNESDVCDRTLPNQTIQLNGRPFQDTNGNCNIGYFDYWRFRNCLVDGRLGYPAPRIGCRKYFDMDLSDEIDLHDFSAFQNAFGGFGP